LSKRFEEALQFAISIHRNQKRKQTNIPYISHLLAVSATVLEYGESEDEAIAALLHDAIEDHPRGGKTAEEIDDRFGPEILALVEGCSDCTTHPKAPWKERKRDYIFRLGQASPAVLLISLADKIHNLRSINRNFLVIGDKIWDRFSAPKDEILNYYRQLGGIYSQSKLPSALVDEYMELLSNFA